MNIEHKVYSVRMNAYLRGLPSRCQHIRLTIDRLFLLNPKEVYKNFSSKF